MDFFDLVVKYYLTFGKLHYAAALLVIYQAMKYILTKDYKGRERRKYDRVGKPIFFLCKSLHLEEPVECIAENIAAGGLMFETDKLFPVETVLSVEIYLPVDPKTTVSIFVKSKVVWVKEIETTELHQVVQKAFPFSQLPLLTFRFFGIVQCLLPQKSIILA